MSDPRSTRRSDAFATCRPTGVAALHPPRAPPDPIAERAALVRAQAVGMALCRDVLSIPPVATMDRKAVSAWLGPTLQRYLVGTP